MITLIAKELNERKVILIIGIILCLLPGIIVLFNSLSGACQGTALKELAWAISFIVLLAISVFYPMFITAPSISGELEKKTLPFLFTLPLSGGKIWLSKLISAALSQISILFLFLAINFNHLHLEELLANLDDPVTALIFSLPLLMLAIVFYASAVASREMSAQGLSLLLLIAALASIASLSYFLEWIMTAQAVLLVISSLIIFFLGASFIIFTGVEQGNDTKKLVKILTVSCPGALFALMFCLIAFRCDEAILAKFPDLVYDIARKGQIVLFKADYGSGNNPRGFSFLNDRLMVYDGKTLTRLPDRNIFWSEVTPWGEIDYRKVRYRQILGWPLGSDVTWQYFRVSADGKQKRLLYSYITPYYLRATTSIFYSGDKTFFILPQTSGGSSRVTLKMMSFSREGRLIEERALPMVRLHPEYLSELPLQVSDGKVYFQYGGSNWMPAKPFSLPGEPILALDRITAESGAIDRIYEIPAIGEDEDFTIHMEPLTIAQDVSCQLFRKKYYRKKHLESVSEEVVKTEIIKRELKSGRETLIYTCKDYEVRLMKLLAGEGLAVIGLSPRENYRFYQLILCNINTGACETLFDAGSNCADIRDIKFSPNGKRAAFIAFHEKGRKNSAFILDIDKGMAKQIFEGNDIDHFFEGQSLCFSPDGKRLALFAFTKSDNEWRSGCPVVINLDSDEKKEFRAMEVKIGRWVSSYYLRLSFHDNNMLIICKERTKIYSLEIPGGKIREIR